jgi:hypothetical protein
MGYHCPLELCFACNKVLLGMTAGWRCSAPVFVVLASVGVLLLVYSRLIRIESRG